MSPRGRRRLGLLGAALVLALVAVPWLSARAGHAPRWAEVERRDLVIEVDVAGTLESVESDLLGPPAIPRSWNFEISFMIPEGSRVETGTPVLKFDSSKLERTLVEMEAEREKADKELDKLAASLEIRRRDDQLALAEAEAAVRLADLKLGQPEGVIAASESAKAALDLELARREVAFYRRRLELIRREESTALGALRDKRDRAAARVAEIRDQIGKLTVVAPHAGTVIYVSDEEGKKRKVGESTWRGAKLLEIPDLSRMRASGEVEEISAGRVAVGQPASFRLDAHPDVVFRGRVAAIERAVRRRSETDPTKVFRLKIDLDETDTERMRPGMRFQGAIEVERLLQVLQVPTAAVFESPEGPLVYRAALVGRQAVRPRLGRRSGEHVEVRAGLDEGDRVALEPPGAGR